MSKIIFAAVLLMGSVGFAKEIHVPESCIEKATGEILKFLENDAPQSDVYPITNKGEISALVDSEGFYGTFFLQTPVSYQKKHATILFADGGVVVFAEVLLKDAQGKPVCEILEVDAGQNDQD